MVDHTVVHFEIPAKDVEKLRKFYSDIFGWKIDKAQGDMQIEYWNLGTVPVDENMRATRPGINGGMYKKTRSEDRPVNYFQVESVDEYLKRIKALGGKIIMPKQEVTKMGWTAIAQDPEGNQFGIFQPMNAEESSES
jgi:predicted enzyme related to lactoylglutathione lyase